MTIRGKLLIRKMTSALKADWDAPLPSESHDEWIQWTKSISSLEDCEVPRMFTEKGLSQLKNTKVAVFVDASDVAISAVAYLIGEDEDGTMCMGFIMGKAKVVPKSCTTIPRKEMCCLSRHRHCSSDTQGIRHRRVPLFFGQQNRHRVHL